MAPEPVIRSLSDTDLDKSGLCSYLATPFTIFAQHPRVGCPSDDEACCCCSLPSRQCCLD